jgi:transposase-like protein
MSDDPVEKQGERLHEELERERRVAGGSHCWRCSSDLRSRVVAYAVACAGDGESHRRIAERVGLIQPTLSRWIREATSSGPSFRPVAIVPSERGAATPAPSTLRLVTPRGFIVEGLDPELLASLLQVLG